MLIKRLTLTASVVILSLATPRTPESLSARNWQALGILAPIVLLTTAVLRRYRLEPRAVTYQAFAPSKPLRSLIAIALLGAAFLAAICPPWQAEVFSGGRPQAVEFAGYHLLGYSIPSSTSIGCGPWGSHSSLTSFRTSLYLPLLFVEYAALSLLFTLLSFAIPYLSSQITIRLPLPGRRT